MTGTFISPFSRNNLGVWLGCPSESVYLHFRCSTFLELRDKKDISCLHLAKSTHNTPAISFQKRTCIKKTLEKPSLLAQFEINPTGTGKKKWSLSGCVAQSRRDDRGVGEPQDDVATRSAPKHSRKNLVRKPNE